MVRSFGTGVDNLAIAALKIKFGRRIDSLMLFQSMWRKSNNTAVIIYTIQKGCHVQHTCTKEFSCP